MQVDLLLELNHCGALHGEPYTFSVSLNDCNVERAHPLVILLAIHAWPGLLLSQSCYKSQKTVCKHGRGDGIQDKVIVHSPIHTPLLHVTETAALVITHIRFLSSVWPVQNIAYLDRDLVTSSDFAVINLFKARFKLE